MDFSMFIFFSLSYFTLLCFLKVLLLVCCPVFFLFSFSEGVWPF